MSKHERLDSSATARFGETLLAHAEPLDHDELNELEPLWASVETSMDPLLDWETGKHV